jgi:TRAP-type C4-dicarboxylate transport system substrate-binding protein
MNTKTHYILLANMKSLKGLSPQQLRAIEKSMIEYSIQAVHDYKYREIKEMANSGIKYIPAITWNNFILWLRKRSFNSAKRRAQLLADIENRKVYAIRNSMIGTRY